MEVSLLDIYGIPMSARRELTALAGNTAGKKQLIHTPGSGLRTMRAFMVTEPPRCTPIGSYETPHPPLLVRGPGAVGG